MTSIKKVRNDKYWLGCEEKGTLIHCWWECKLVQLLWKTVWRLLKKIKNRTSLPDHISTCHSLLKRNENVLFLKQLWQAMKSGYCTIMCNRRDSGASEMNHHQPHQRPVFIQRRWCAYGGIGRESSIMSSFRKTEQLIPTTTAPNETNWKQHSMNSVRN